MTSAPGVVTLRPMRWWDVEHVVPVERELFTTDAWTAETWWGELAQVAPGGGRWYVLAERDGGCVGYAGVSVNGVDADVMTVAVSPAAQGIGVGGVLLRALVERTAAAGATQLLLEVRADNDAAGRLYARHGFQQVAVRRGYYGDVDGLVLRLRPLSGPVDSLRG